MYRGNTWSNYTKIEAKNVKGETLKTNGKYNKDTNILKINFDVKVKMNDIKSVMFLN